MPAIGFNVHAMYTTQREKDELIAHYRITKPGATVIMDDPGFAHQIAKTLPNTLTVARRSGDDNCHLPGNFVSPEQWLTNCLSEFPRPHLNNLTIHYNNEPGISKALNDHALACAKLVAPHTDVKVVWLNFSVGNPNAADWGLIEPFIRYISQPQFKGRFFLGLHEYALPDALHDWNQGIDPRKWPTRLDGVGLLIGRVRAFDAWCIARGINPVDVVVTEFGYDVIRAYDLYQQGLKHTPGHPMVGAPHANVEQWKFWTRELGLDWTPFRYAFESLYRVWKIFYNTPRIRGVCLFCYGGIEGRDEKGDPRWRLGYDYSKSSMPEFLPLLEKADWTMATSPTPTPIPIPETYLTDATWRFNVRIRATPNTSATVKGSIPAGKRAQITGAAHVNQGFIWTPIVYNGVSGWSALGEVETPATPAPAPDDDEPSIRFCDGFDQPVGSAEDRASSEVWAGGWIDANPFLNLTPGKSYHTGSDLNLNVPTWDSDKLMPFYACADGVVIWAQSFRVWGNLIILKHAPLPDGTVMYSRYAHSATIEVRTGDTVKRGQMLGRVGNAENTMAYHLHLDFCKTDVLEHKPTDWPGLDRMRIEQNYVDPKVFIWKNRPRL